MTFICHFLMWPPHSWRGCLKWGYRWKVSHASGDLLPPHLCGMRKWQLCNLQTTNLQSQRTSFKMFASSVVFCYCFCCFFVFFFPLDYRYISLFLISGCGELSEGNRFCSSDAELCGNICTICAPVRQKSQRFTILNGYASASVSLY